MNWKNLLLSSILIVLLLFLNQVVVVSASYTNVSVSPAKEMIESNPNLVILDVRTLEEYESGHIENAVLIPVTELEARIDELDKEKETLVYCRSGVRSATASEMLVANGFVSVYNMLGGIIAWINAGYWIEIIHKGDLVIDGTQTYVIENCTFIQKGNIYVKDWAKLIVRNAELQINLTSLWQYEFVIEEHGILELEHAILMSDYALNLYFRQHSKAYFNNVTLNLGEHSFLNFWDSSKATIHQLTFSFSVHFFAYSDASITHSRIHEIEIFGETCDIKISDTSIEYKLHLNFNPGVIVNVDNLKPGFYEYLDLKEKVTIEQNGMSIPFRLTLNNTYCPRWTVDVRYDSQTIISDSLLYELRITIVGLFVRIDGLVPQFYEYIRIGQITLNNTQISTITVHVFQESSDVTITNSTLSSINLHWPGLSSNVCLINTGVGNFHIQSFLGNLCFENTTWMGGRWILYSDFYMYGSVTLEDLERIRWHLSNVTRNYGIIVKDRYNEPVSNTSLILLSEEDVIIWNGTTDNQGKANFNLTFTDSNYTDTLKLEAVKGDFSTTMNVSFLSDTPVILTMRYFADLNGDGKVDIRDITIVARAYGSKPEDPNWNAIADLNNDEIIDIRDITIVAMEFGKTV